MSVDKFDFDRKIVDALDKLTRVHRTMLWEVAKTENLSPIQIQFLEYINRYPSKLCKVSTLAREFDLTKATVSAAVSSLEEKCLLRKLRESNDKRSYVLKLTPEGKRIVKRLLHWSDAMVKHIEKFSDEDKSRVMLFLMELIKSLFDDGVVEIAHVCIACTNFVRDADKSSPKPHFCRLTNRSISNSELNIGCSSYSCISRK